MCNKRRKCINYQNIVLMSERTGTINGEMKIINKEPKHKSQHNTKGENKVGRRMLSD